MQFQCGGVVYRGFKKDEIETVLDLVDTYGDEDGDLTLVKKQAGPISQGTKSITYAIFRSKSDHSEIYVSHKHSDWRGLLVHELTHLKQSFRVGYHKSMKPMPMLTPTEASVKTYRHLKYLMSPNEIEAYHTQAVYLRSVGIDPHVEMRQARTYRVELGLNIETLEVL